MPERQVVVVPASVDPPIVVSRQSGQLAGQQDQPRISAVIPVGQPGRTGATGPPGPQGPPGGESYIFTQSVPSAHWVISHGLSTIPSVTIIDSANREVYGDVSYVDANNLVIDFGAAFSGTAYLL